MRRTIPRYTTSMADCHETNPLWYEMMYARNIFLNQEDWQQTAQKYFEENKDEVHEQWLIGMMGWETYDYFAAGMYYGRVLNLLMTGSVLG